MKQAPATMPTVWEELWTDYEVLKRSSLSPTTLANYRDTFAQLARFLGPAPPALAAVTKRQIAAFIDFTRQQTSASTAAMRFRGLRAVLSWLANPGEDDEPFLPKNPMTGLKQPKLDEQPVAVLKLTDAKRLLAACRGQDFEDRRDEALIRFLFDTGCRRGEVASMKVAKEWLDLRDGTAMVDGKTGPRVVAFGPKTGAALHRYMRLRQHRAGRTETALWIGRRGPLLGNGIYQALSRRFEEAGVTSSKRAHVFRHTFSHEWRVAGGSEGDLMSLNGWTSPAMAHRYGRSAAAARAREAHRRLSPGERL